MTEDDIMKAIYDLTAPEFSDENLSEEFKAKLSKVVKLKERQNHLQKDIETLESYIKNCPIYGSTDPSVITSFIDKKRELELLKGWKNDLHTEEIGIAYEFYQICLKEWMDHEFKHVLKHASILGTEIVIGKFVESKYDHYFNFLNDDGTIDRESVKTMLSDFIKFIDYSITNKKYPLD